MGLQRARHDLVNSQNKWEKPRKTESLTKTAKTFTYLHPSSAKDKKGCLRKGLGHQMGRKAIHMEMEKKILCLVNKYLLGPAETMGPR